MLIFSLAKIAVAGAYDELLNPPTYSKPECEALQNAVWVDVSWQDNKAPGKQDQRASACIKYFPSDNAAGASTAVIFIDGDVSDGSEEGRSAYETMKSRGTEFANVIAGQTNLPVIRLTRPGTFGSSGMSHLRDRRMPIEVHLVNAAVTKIKERYGYERVQLAGQSTGGGLVGALMTLGRNDIDCAVIGSGVTSVKTRSSHLNSSNFRQGKDETGNDLSAVYDPIDHVSKVAPDSSRRIFILGDPRDEAVSFASQREFHERLVNSGIPSTLLVAEAKDAKHHFLGASAQRVAGLCKNGRSDAEILELVKNKAV